MPSLPLALSGLGRRRPMSMAALNKSLSYSPGTDAFFPQLAFSLQGRAATPNWTGTNSIWGAGPFGALAFSPSPGGTGYISYAANGATWTKATPQSGIAWIQTTDNADNCVVFALDTQPGWQFLVINGTLTFALWTSSSFNSGRVVQGIPVNDGKWHQVGYSYDGSNTVGGIKLYVDGKATTTSTLYNTDPGAFAAAALTLSSSTPGSTGFIGSIDHFLLHNAVWPAKVFSLLYQNPFAFLQFPARWYGYDPSPSCFYMSGDSPLTSSFDKRRWRPFMPEFTEFSSQRDATSQAVMPTFPVPTPGAWINDTDRPPARSEWPLSRNPGWFDVGHVTPVFEDVATSVVWVGQSQSPERPLHNRWFPFRPEHLWISQNFSPATVLDGKLMGSFLTEQQLPIFPWVRPKVPWRYDGIFPPNINAITPVLPSASSNEPAPWLGSRHPPLAPQPGNSQATLALGTESTFGEWQASWTVPQRSPGRLASAEVQPIADPGLQPMLLPFDGPSPMLPRFEVSRRGRSEMLPVPVLPVIDRSRPIIDEAGSVVLDENGQPIFDDDPTAALDVNDGQLLAWNVAPQPYVRKPLPPLSAPAEFRTESLPDAAGWMAWSTVVPTPSPRTWRPVRPDQATESSTWGAGFLVGYLAPGIDSALAWQGLSSIPGRRRWMSFVPSGDAVAQQPESSVLLSGWCVAPPGLPPRTTATGRISPAVQAPPGDPEFGTLFTDAILWGAWMMPAAGSPLPGRRLVAPPFGDALGVPSPTEASAMSWGVLPQVPLRQPFARYGTWAEGQSIQSWTLTPDVVLAWNVPSPGPVRPTATVRESALAWGPQTLGDFAALGWHTTPEVPHLLRRSLASGTSGVIGGSAVNDSSQAPPWHAYRLIVVVGPYYASTGFIYVSGAAQGEISTE